MAKSREYNYSYARAAGGLNSFFDVTRSALVIARHGDDDTRLRLSILYNITKVHCTRARRRFSNEEKLKIINNRIIIM